MRSKVSEIEQLNNLEGASVYSRQRWPTLARGYEGYRSWEVEQ